MDTTALLLSRLQFAFTISFHIIFPAFSIGLAAWLTILEALHLKTGRPAYRVLFEFWLKLDQNRSQFGGLGAISPHDVGSLPDGCLLRCCDRGAVPPAE